MEKEKQYFNEALKILDLFKENADISYIEKAGKLLIQQTFLDKNAPEPFAYLAYIFYILKNKEYALKYLNSAERLFVSIPFSFLELKKEILKMESNIINEQKIQASKNINLSPPPEIKMSVPKKSTFWKFFN